MNGNIITDDEYNNIGYDWLIRLLVEWTIRCFSELPSKAIQCLFLRITWCFPTARKLNWLYAFAFNRLKYSRVLQTAGFAAAGRRQSVAGQVLGVVGQAAVFAGEAAGLRWWCFVLLVQQQLRWHALRIFPTGLLVLALAVVRTTTGTSSDCLTALRRLGH